MRRMPAMVLLLAGVTTGQPLSAWASDLTTVRTGLPHDALFDIELHGTRGIAVGDYGTVLTTEDGGSSWVEAPRIAETVLTGVASNGDVTLIVGQQGRIFRGADRSNFQSVETPTHERLMSVALAADGRAVAVGGFGAILLSKDAGATWQQPEVDWAALSEDGLEAHLYAVQLRDDGAVLVAGEFGFILRSTDFGASWQRLHTSDESVFAMHFIDKDHGFAVGQNGLVMRTVDGGGTWQRLVTNTDANLLDVWASAEGEVVVVGVRALLRSSDGGSSWHAGGGRQVERAWFQALGAGIVTHSSGGDSLDQERVYAVGHTGQIVAIDQ